MLCSPPPFAKKWRWRDSCRHTYERVKFRVWCHMWEDFSSLTFCSQKFGRAASKNIMVGVNIYIITFLFEFDHWLWLLSTSIFVPLKKCERSPIFGWGIIIISYIYFPSDIFLSLIWLVSGFTTWKYRK